MYYRISLKSRPELCHRPRPPHYEAGELKSPATFSRCCTRFCYYRE